MTWTTHFTGHTTDPEEEANVLSAARDFARMTKAQTASATTSHHGTVDLLAASEALPTEV